MQPKMVLFSLCHLVCQEHALFMFYHFQNDISKVQCVSVSPLVLPLLRLAQQVGMDQDRMARMFMDFRLLPNP